MKTEKYRFVIISVIFLLTLACGMPVFKSTAPPFIPTQGSGPVITQQQAVSPAVSPVPPTQTTPAGLNLPVKTSPAAPPGVPTATDRSEDQTSLKIPSVPVSSLPTNKPQPSTPDLFASPVPEGTPQAPNLEDYYSESLHSGKWEAAGGILQLLRFFTGKVSSADVFGDKPPRNMEITGLVARAREFLKKNPAAKEREEIEQLLNILLPDVNRILPYAGPEEKADAGLTRLVSLEKRPLPDEECNRLWWNGFPSRPGASPQMCISYRSFSAGSSLVRVFYPRGWDPGVNLSHRVDWTEAGIRDSVTSFSPLALSGMPPQVDVIFTLVSSPPEHGSTVEDAMAADPRAAGRCVIGVFPVSLRDSENNFKQSIAHEMFHCFQFVNMARNHMFGYDDKKWWIEGSAEYFSNVVYPSNNAEFGFSGDLDSGMLDHSLLSMSYADFAFFKREPVAVRYVIHMHDIQSRIHIGGHLSPRGVENDAACGGRFDVAGTYGRRWIDDNSR